MSFKNGSRRVDTLRVLQYRNGKVLAGSRELAEYSITGITGAFGCEEIHAEMLRTKLTAALKSVHLYRFVSPSGGGASPPPS